MENHMRSLQEGYKLLSTEDLKQLQEEQNVDDENIDEKVVYSLCYIAGCSNILFLVGFFAWLCNYVLILKNETSEICVSQ